MNIHIVNQLRFARAEFRKGLDGVSEAEGYKQFGPINTIGWIVGHMAWHEQFYWLTRAQGETPYSNIVEQVGFGKPASHPSLTEMKNTWSQVIQEADNYLECLSKEGLEKHMVVNGQSLPFNIGTMVSRVIYHYWYHNGEIQALRQMMGHSNLPDFVSDDIETIGAFYLD